MFFNNIFGLYNIITFLIKIIEQINSNKINFNIDFTLFYLTFILFILKTGFYFSLFLKVLVY